MDAHRDPAAWTVVGLATIGGIIGTVAGAWIAFAHEGFFGAEPDYAHLVIDNVWALSAAALGGGIGWSAGAIAGWRSVSKPAPPSINAVVVLSGLAFAVVALAFLILLPVAPGGAETLDDLEIGYATTPLWIIVLLDTALAVGTFLLVATQRNIPPGVVRSGVVFGAAILIAGVFVFGSILPPERAWLQRWLTTCQENLGTAPNLITPAPIDCGGQIPEPDIVASPLGWPSQGAGDGPYRNGSTLATDVPMVRWWINPYAPRWLPDGFGLALDRSWTFPAWPRAAWIDPECREITLQVMWRRSENPPGPSLARLIGRGSVVEKIGGWVRVLAPEWCEDPASSCREYVARAPIHNDGPATYLLVRTVGIDGAEADRIPLSIPLGPVA